MGGSATTTTWQRRAANPRGSRLHGVSMTRFDYDLFVIGAGSGGIRASRISRHLGAKVAVAENYRIGGTCVIRGCIPKKLLTYAPHYPQALEHPPRFAWRIHGPSF